MVMPLANSLGASHELQSVAPLPANSCKEAADGYEHVLAAVYLFPS